MFHEASDLGMGRSSRSLPTQTIEPYGSMIPPLEGGPGEMTCSSHIGNLVAHHPTLALSFLLPCVSQAEGENKKAAHEGGRCLVGPLLGQCCCSWSAQCGSMRSAKSSLGSGGIWLDVALRGPAGQQVEHKPT